MFACMLASWHPAFELFTHMSLHMFFVCLLVALLLLIRMGSQIRIVGTRRLRLLQVIFLSVPTVYFAIQTKPWELLYRTPQQVVASPTVKIFSWNVWLQNFRGEDIEVVARSSDADVLVLLEVNYAVGEMLQDLRNSSTYKANYWAPEWSASGIVILSKFEGTTFSEVDLLSASSKGIEVTVPAVGDRPMFRVLAVHTRSPTTFQRSLERDEQFEALADWARWQEQPAVIIGDLNVTPWSPAYRKLLIDGELNDSRNGFGACASWPSFLGPIGIPIDHALTNGACRAVERSVFSAAPGSDHRPISVTLELTGDTKGESKEVNLDEPEDDSETNRRNPFRSDLGNGLQSDIESERSPDTDASGALASPGLPRDLRLSIEHFWMQGIGNSMGKCAVVNSRATRSEP
jgi:endonuclease/exonuclease/phosphatase (EEP) superfamily protein YafD